MRRLQMPLTSRQVKDHAEGLLHENLRLKDYSARCPTTVLYALLLYVASRATTIAHACKYLWNAPCDQTIYNALARTSPKFLELQRRLNRTLAASLPRRLRNHKSKRRYPIALDLHLVPYYGLPKDDEDEIYKGKHERGTNLYHGYATAYLVRKGHRVTLAILAVTHSTPWEDIVRDLLRMAVRLVGGVRLVLLDRGFWSVAVIRYLQRARYPFLMPVLGRGRKVGDPRGPGGSNVFFAWRASGWSRYTLEAGKKAKKAGKDAKATVLIAVRVCRAKKARSGSKPSKKKRRVLVYAAWGVGAHTPEWVKQTYRKRFGIETSYRQGGQARGWTTSRCPVRRLLLFGLAMLLRNVWAYLHAEYLAQWRKGWPRLYPDQLTLAIVLNWIAKVIEDLFGTLDSVDPQDFWDPLLAPRA